MEKMCICFPIESSPKMYIYSCHDSTVAALLLALGCYDNEWPPYAADIAFELYKDADGGHWVKLRYCSKVISVSQSISNFL